MKSRLLKKAYFRCLAWITLKTSDLKNQLVYSAYVPKGRVIWINPKTIKGRLYVPAKRQKGFSLKGSQWKIRSHPVLGGDWDLYVKPMQDIIKTDLKYVSCKEHFLDNIPWEKTTIFKERYQKQLNASGRSKGKNSLSAILDGYHILDNIWDNIEDDGILPPDRKGISALLAYIDRNGDFIYTSRGNHRLALALLSGLDKIPVVVTTRHKSWQKVREEIKKTPPKKRLSTFEGLINHPDLQDLLCD